MRKPRFSTISGAIFASLLAGSAVAEELPADAVKMSAADLKKVYAGKSSNWTRSRTYFAPDGTIKWIRKDKSAYGDGKWTVKGNRVCMLLNWNDVDSKESGRSKDCWDWYRSGRKYMTLWSVRFNGEKAKKDDYYDGEFRKLQRGDRVTRTHNRLAS